jgi:hypothetical protein
MTSQIKDRVKPAGSQEPAGQKSTPGETQGQPRKSTIVDVIEWTKLNTSAKLWKIDQLELTSGETVVILVGRATTRDGSRTFPAVVIRLLGSDGNIIRDYTISARVAYYLIAWFSETTDKKASVLIDFVKAFATFQSRVMNIGSPEDIETGE